MVRGFTRLIDREVHWRREGRGPPLIALHPSPMSSQAMVPLMQALADRYTVYAPDTPGYGLSEPDSSNPRQASDYAAALHAWIEAMGLSRFALYGSATGAQIALEYAKRHPERIALLVLDNAAHFDDQHRSSLLAQYFPDLSPRPSGAHLAELWHFVRESLSFFPWFDARRVTRLPRDLPPPSAIHDAAIDLMRAGPDYHRAYRAAFENEHISRYAGLAAPTALIRWHGSILLPQIDALIAAGLPATVAVHDAEPAARYETIRRALASFDWPEHRPTTELSERRFQALRDGLLHIRMRRAGSARPIIRLHAPGGSMAADAREFSWPQDRPALRIDLPGHGESDAFPGCNPAGAVAEAARELGFLDVDISAADGSAALARALADELPRADWVPGDAGRANAVADGIDLTPVWDGTHLLRAWRYARELALFSQPFGPSRGIVTDEHALTPERLAVPTLALLQCRWLRRDGSGRLPFATPSNVDPNEPAAN